MLVLAALLLEVGREVGVASGLAEHRFAVFPKQFVVRVDLAVYVGGLKDGHFKVAFGVVHGGWCTSLLVFGAVCGQRGQWVEG